MGAIYVYIDCVYGAIYMYIDCVYGCYIHVFSLCIWVLYTCILMVYMSAIYMYIDCAYGLYIHFYPAISTFAVQICYTNKFLLYSY